MIPNQFNIDNVIGNVFRAICPSTVDAKLILSGPLVGAPCAVQNDIADELF